MKKASTKLRIVGSLILILLLVLLNGCGAQPTPVDPVKKLTEFTKPAVVRVVAYTSATYKISSLLAGLINANTENDYFVGGMGSGAIISPNGYIVTNAHVVETAKLDEKELKQKLDEQFLNDLWTVLKAKTSDPVYWYDYALNTTTRGELQNVYKVILPGGDIYTFDVKSYGAPLGEGKNVAVIKIDANNLPSVLIDESDQASTSDQVIIAGYPGGADLAGFLDEKSAMVSTYTEGSIAARKSSDKGPLLQLAADINPGNSGGPIFTTDGKMIGIATATSKGANGIGWAIPSSTILEFARQAGAPINQVGVVTQRWQEGLNLFWQDYYQKAIPKFEEVQRLYPKHYAVADYISKSQKAIEDGKNRTDLNDYLPYIIGGVGLIVITGGVILVIVLRKKKELPLDKGTDQGISKDDSIKREE